MFRSENSQQIRFWLFCFSDRSGRDLLLLQGHPPIFWDMINSAESIIMDILKI